MPTATANKRRKLGVAPQNALPRGGMNHFAKVSKATTAVKAVTEKNNHAENFIIPPLQSLLPLQEQRLSNHKRKILESDHDTPTSTVCRSLKPLPQRKSKNFPLSPHTPENATLKSPFPASIDTPTKGARNLLDNFFLVSETKAQSSLNDCSFSSNLDASTPKHNSQPPAELPAELVDLINLHASFLTALSIHYAHNGSHSPADLQVLCKDVARAWGKRRVLVKDIQKSLGVLNSGHLIEKDGRISKLTLSDYGHGRVFVELQADQGKPGRIARPINEDSLNELYVAALGKAWVRGPDLDVERFVEGLPLEPIKICPSFVKISPTLAKGQRRLDDLRTGATMKREEKKQQMEERTNGPKMTLLERLRAKQLHQSTLPPPLSKAQLARSAALGRMEEVVAVLSILSTSGSIGQSRVSFTLPTVLSKLKDSFRTPISKAEAETCLRLLASETAPEWIRIVNMGRVEALVVNREERPSEEEVRLRVRSST